MSRKLDKMLCEVREIVSARNDLMRRERMMQVLPIAEFPLFSAIADRISSSRKMPAYEARVAYVFSAIAVFSPFSLVGQKPPRGLRNKIAEHLCISKGHASHEITRVAALARLDGRLKPLLDDVLQSVLQEISALNRNVP